MSGLRIIDEILAGQRDPKLEFVHF
jgi:hypothetical protein